ncbi:MAG: AraC family transcriptional regulator [Bacilli bacterium]|jgi:AraC-like DNA-binding protein|nr:AraC family transcriptional regulator [Bacilli bacterium]
MDNLQIKDSLDLISEVNHLPVFIFSADKKLIFEANKEIYPAFLAQGFLNSADLMEASQNPRILLLGEYEEYYVFPTSFAQEKKCYCLIGPAFLGKPNQDGEERLLSFASFIPKPSLTSIIANIDTFISSSFAQLVSLIRLLLTGKFIPPWKILEIAEKNLTPSFEEIQQTIEDRFSEGKQKYNYDQEQQALQAVREGRTAEAEKLARFFNHGRFGVLSANPNKDALYLCICLITLVTRAAMQGGLNPAVAYAMSDEYILKLDEAENATSYVAISQAFIGEITKKVHDSKRKNMNYSEAISRSVDYIQNNLASELSMEKAAKDSGFSYRYFSRLFKKEVKMTFSQFVKKERIERAKNALAYTTQSEAEISFALGFANPSYFIKTFRKVVGETPFAYRERILKEGTLAKEKN